MCAHVWYELRGVWMLTVWVLTKSRIVAFSIAVYTTSLRKGLPLSSFGQIYWDLPVCPQLGVGARDSNSDCEACSGNFSHRAAPQPWSIKI